MCICAMPGLLHGPTPAGRLAGSLNLAAYNCARGFYLAMLLEIALKLHQNSVEVRHGPLRETPRVYRSSARVAQKGGAQGATLF